MSLKNKQKVSPTSKLWLSLQSEQSLLREVYSRRPRLFPPHEKLQHELKLNSSAAHFKPTSLIAADFQQRNRDLQLYGKNQFSIRYQKTGTDHTLTVNPAMIRGEPIISISALKVPLCRQRFLRTCPLYFSHTGRTEKKTGNQKIAEVSQKEKENQMTFVHGNKSSAFAAGLCVSTAALLCACMLSEKRAKIKLYEKKYTSVVSSVQERNLQLMNENGAGSE